MKGTEDRGCVVILKNLQNINTRLHHRPYSFKPSWATLPNVDKRKELV
jgi:hypothetical protein